MSSEIPTSNINHLGPLLIQASIDGNLDEIKRLIKLIDPNYCPKSLDTSLIATKEVINFLDFQDRFGWTALTYAVRDGQFKIVKFLIETGASINIKDKNGQTPLTFSTSNVYFGSRGMTRKLIKAGIKRKLNNPQFDLQSYLDSRDNCGYTALMGAALNNDSDAVQVLIKAGASVDDHHCKYGHTALEWAIRINNFEIVQSLIRAGASIDFYTTE